MCFNAQGEHLCPALKETGLLAAYRLGDASGPTLLGEVSAAG